MHLNQDRLPLIIKQVGLESIQKDKQKFLDVMLADHEFVKSHAPLRKAVLGLSQTGGMYLFGTALGMFLIRTVMVRRVNWYALTKADSAARLLFLYVALPHYISTKMGLKKLAQELENFDFQHPEVQARM